MPANHDITPVNKRLCSLTGKHLAGRRHLLFMIDMILAF